MMIAKINKTLLKFFNLAIFSKISRDMLDEESKVWKKSDAYYCGYHKNFDITDWRFSENNKRKNVKFTGLVIKKSIKWKVK